MVVLFRTVGGKHHKMRRPFLRNKSSLGDDIKFQVDPSGSPIHVVIVMDGLKEFTTGIVEWVLENIINCSGCVITLIGVMPWLNIPLSSKTWLDVWSVELEQLAKERSECIKSEFKYLKLKAAIDLCRSYGVVLQKKVVMGYPSRLLVVEQIISLGATLVVFDRHQKNDREFFVKKIPCNIVVMNENREVDMIKRRSTIESSEEMSSSTPGESPALVPTPKLIISEQFKGLILKERSQGNCDQDYDDNEVLRVRKITCSYLNI